jgi:hypothetical protein
MTLARTVRTVQTEVGAVLQNTSTGATFSTNIVGARVCMLLAKGLSRHEIVDRVSSDFAVSRDLVERDLEEFFEGLKQKGLLEQNITTTR